MNQPEQMHETQGAPEPVAVTPPPPPQIAASTDPRIKSPAVAAVLSLLPGLGQVYVGYYHRGFFNALIFGGLVALLAGESLGALTPIVGIFMAFFYLFNVIDAARRASLYNQALAGGDQIDLPRDFQSPGIGGSMFGGASLIAIGLILLANTRFDMSLDWIEDWWPAGIVIFGAYLVYKAVQDKKLTDSLEDD